MVRERRDLDLLEVDELVRRGIAASRVGETDEARTYLQAAAERDPDRADVWLWLAGLEPDPKSKRVHFERVLALRPDDPEATAGLARLAEKYGDAVLVPDDEVESLRCTWHPDRETLLRCNRCSRPMCTACAVRHPVGLRCKECARELRSPLYNVSPVQYAAAAAAGLAVSTLAAFLMAAIGGFWFVAFFIGAAVGTAVAEAVSVASGRKRGRGLQIVTGAAMVLGVLVAGALLAGGLGPRALAPLTNLGVLIYLFVGIGAAAARLR